MSSEGEDDVLTSREGFLAMAEFLERFYDRGHVLAEGKYAVVG